MKLDEALAALSHFFNDIVGAIIPGVVLFIGLFLIHGDQLAHALIDEYSKSVLIFLVGVGLAYAAGHGLLAIHSMTLQTLLKWLRLIKKAKIEDEVEKSNQYILLKAFSEDKLGKAGASLNKQLSFNLPFHDLRSIVLTLSETGASLARRFMFISLLCNGVGTALFILGVDTGICLFIWRSALMQYANVHLYLVQIFGLLALCVVFCKRGDDFYRRAMKIAFSVGAADLFIRDGNDTRTENG